MKPVTVSVIKADVGSIGGHTRPSDEMMEEVEGVVNNAVVNGVLIDGMVTFTGDDIAIIASHKHGVDAEPVHIGVAMKAFRAATEVARRQGLYGAGQDLLNDAPSGNVRGAGPGVAELTFELLPSHRKAEAFLVFAADKCGPGAYNQPLTLAFCDPMHNSGLLISAAMNQGWVFEVVDMDHTEGDRTIRLSVPEQYWDLVTLLRNPDRFAIRAIWSRAFPDEQVVAASTSRLHNVAGTYVGKDDPVCIVRAQGIFPAPEELVHPWATLHPLVTGDCRGSHHMPMLTVPVKTAVTGAFCLPLVSCLAFSMAPDGSFTNAMVDKFDNPAWDAVRSDVVRYAMQFRNYQGPWGPGMASQEELAYTGMRDTLARLGEQFQVQ